MSEQEKENSTWAMLEPTALRFGFDHLVGIMLLPDDLDLLITRSISPMEGGIEKRIKCEQESSNLPSGYLIGYKVARTLVINGL